MSSLGQPPADVNEIHLALLLSVILWLRRENWEKLLNDCKEKVKSLFGAQTIISLPLEQI